MFLALPSHLKQLRDYLKQALVFIVAWTKKRCFCYLRTLYSLNTNYEL